jgi:cytochrome bd-type quinol oxidase subunit 1
MRPAVWIIGGVVLLTFALGLFYFFDTYELQEVKSLSSLKGEARENPLFATRLFLKRMGIPAENKDSLQGIGKLPDDKTVLLIDTTRSTLSIEKTDELIDWVKQGGHLITRASIDREWSLLELEEEDGNKDEEEENTEKSSQEEDLSAYSLDPLHRALDIHTIEDVFVDFEDDDKKKKDENDFKSYAIQMKNMPKSLKFYIGSYLYPIVSKDEQEERVYIGTHLFMIQRKIGKGMITLASDLEFVENNLVRKVDNAEILWYLVHAHHKQPDGVWLVHNDEMPPLWKLIWKYGRMVVISLLLLLIAWLFMKSRRFGPLINKEKLARRRLMEHIEASGNYFWKNNQRQKLIDSSRQALIKRIAQTHPGWHQYQPEEQTRVLAEQLEQTPENIHKLLHTNEFEHPDDFTKLVSQLEKIRKSL